jgi:hypothetical protein
VPEAGSFKTIWSANGLSSVLRCLPDSISAKRTTDYNLLGRAGAKSSTLAGVYKLPVYLVFADQIPLQKRCGTSHESTDTTNIPTVYLVGEFEGSVSLQVFEMLFIRVWGYYAGSGIARHCRGSSIRSRSDSIKPCKSPGTSASYPDNQKSYCRRHRGQEIWFVNIISPEPSYRMQLELRRVEEPRLFPWRRIGLR